MSETTWPAADDVFPSEGAIGAALQSGTFAGIGKHSGLLRKMGSAIEAIEAAAGPRVFYAGTPTGVAVTDNANVQAAVTACAAAGGGDVVFDAGNYNLTTPLTGLLVGGSFSAGTVRGIRFRGMGRGVTLITYAPSAATFWATIGNGSSIGGFYTFEDITFVGGNNTLGGILRFRDPANFCVVQRCEFLGNGTATVGDAIRLDGQTVACSGHEISQCTFKYWLNGIHLSGFGNSNEVRNCWFGSIGVGLLFEAAAPDTEGGDTNAIIRCEFNGSTGVAVKMRNGANRNDFFACTMDGPTVHFDLANGCNGNGIWGGSWSPVLSTFSGTANFHTITLSYDSTPDIAGALTAVTDVNAKAVLQSIINTLCGNTGIANDATT